MIVIDGKKVRDELLEKYKNQILEENLKLKLVVILIGDDAASKLYIKNKEKACEKCNIAFENIVLDKDVTFNEVKDIIDKLNNDNSVTGIILQSPIPNHLDYEKLANMIKSDKDIDGFTLNNVNKLYMNKEELVPCTPKGIISLLDYYNIPLEGKKVTIVGRSNIVGKPLMLALLNRNATVCICHSKTNNLKEETLNADIVIVAIGKANFITKDMIKDNAVVIDVGINYVDDKLTGDVCYEEVKDKCSYITPVPGGVGPMTIASIISNLIIASKKEK